MNSRGIQLKRPPPSVRPRVMWWFDIRALPLLNLHLFTSKVRIVHLCMQVKAQPSALVPLRSR